MVTLLWILAGVVGVTVMVAASRVAIRHAVALAEALHVPTFFIAITLVALGTDMPEMFNSIVASYLGQGDINIGDSTGSVFTQGSMIGLFPFFASSALLVERRDVMMLPGLTIICLATGVLLMADGSIARTDAALLVFLWVVFTGIAWRFRTAPPVMPKHGATPGGVLPHLVPALLALAAIGAAAAVVVAAIVAISASIGVPEYILSFLGASIGTSLPELAVEFTALRKGQQQLAMGDGLGSCLVDSSLSIAVGPLLFPTAVTASFAVQGAIIASVTMLIVGLLLGIRRKLDRIAGALLIAAYFLAYVFFFAAR